MIKIEFEDPVIEKCSCCDNEYVRLTRFVYNDENAFAVYYANFTKGHEDKVVYGIISIGEWGDGAKEENRFAFPYRIWTDAENYQVGLLDRNESLWKDETFLGNILDRKMALLHPLIRDVFHITDHIVVEDIPVIEYLSS